MTSAQIKRHALVAYAAVVLVGCGGPVSREDGLPALPFNFPTTKAKSHDLLYLSNVRTNEVDVYAYSNGGLVRKLNGFGKPRAECADTQGNVWITDVEAEQIVEYAHGGAAPIRALSTPGTPHGCSVGPRGNEVAVAGVFQNGTSVAVYRRSAHDRWRSARLYGDSSMKRGYFCGYDERGDLFVDGFAGRRTESFRLSELAHGGSTLLDLTVSQRIHDPGQVQWDGNHVAVGDAGRMPAVVYRFSISASKATEVGKTTLGGTTSVRQFWIDGDQIIGPNYETDVGFWKYPAGGLPVRSISIPGYGAAVSKAVSR